MFCIQNKWNKSEIAFAKASKPKIIYRFCNSVHTYNALHHKSPCPFWRKFKTLSVPYTRENTLCVCVCVYAAFINFCNSSLLFHLLSVTVKIIIFWWLGGYENSLLQYSFPFLGFCIKNILYTQSRLNYSIGFMHLMQFNIPEYLSQLTILIKQYNSNFFWDTLQPWVTADGQQCHLWGKNIHIIFSVHNKIILIMILFETNSIWKRLCACNR